MTGWFGIVKNVTPVDYHPAAGAAVRPDQAVPAGETARTGRIAHRENGPLRLLPNLHPAYFCDKTCRALLLL